MANFTIDAAGNRHPSPAFVDRSPLHAFMLWLAKQRGLHFRNYDELWRWSVTDLDTFWRAIWDYFAITAEGEMTSVVNGQMPGAVWFEGTRLNYAEHVLRLEAAGDPERPMFRHASEVRPLRDASWAEVASQVRKLATRLREMGIAPGDRVVAYLPNIIETVIAMLASTAVGAVWASAAPEFGEKTVVDRFGQIRPKLLFAVDGYRYGGKDFDRSGAVAAIVDAVNSIETVVWLDYLSPHVERPSMRPVQLTWNALLDGPEIPAADFHYTRVDSRHPLWVLFSSGTTGLPKVITHNHHGVLIEGCKATAFHFNIKAGDCLFFYTTTGWMMWNTLMNAPLLNAISVLFDGHPNHPDPLTLWALADRARVTAIGTNPTITQIMEKQGIVPKDHFALADLKAVILAGSPSTPAAFEWVWDNIGDDLWISSQSGGTEFCSGLLGGVPERRVVPGQIQGPCLGVAAYAFDDDGNAVVGQPGELVLTKPLPSMPIRLWGDEDYKRYRETYFTRWPHVWVHGDSCQFNADGTCFVFGRSDATLNRYGVRIGSAEIYRTLDGIKGIADSLVVCIEEEGGAYYMPLFVALTPGISLDDALKSEIVRRLRAERSPRHVPDVIIEAPGIPQTITGKRMEVPVRKLLMGVAPAKAYSPEASKVPAVMEWFVEFAARRLAERSVTIS